MKKKPNPPPKSHKEPASRPKPHDENPGDDTLTDEKAAKALRAIAEVSAKLPRNG